MSNKNSFGIRHITTCQIVCDHWHQKTLFVIMSTWGIYLEMFIIILTPLKYKKINLKIDVPIFNLILISTFNLTIKN